MHGGGEYSIDGGSTWQPCAGSFVVSSILHWKAVAFRDGKNQPPFP